MQTILANMCTVCAQYYRRGRDYVNQSIDQTSWSSIEDNNNRIVSLRNRYQSIKGKYPVSNNSTLYIKHKYTIVFTKMLKILCRISNSLEFC